MPSIMNILQFTYAQVEIEITDGTSYRVYRTRGYTQSEFNDGLLDTAAYYPIGMTTTATYNDLALIALRYYRYRVSALNEYGESDIGGSSGGLDYYQYYHC